MNANPKQSTQKTSADVALRKMTIGIIIGGLGAVCADLTFPLAAHSNIIMIQAIAGLYAGGVFFFNGFVALPEYYDLKVSCEFTNACRK